jgi:hypothetical protein
MRVGGGLAYDRTSTHALYQLERHEPNNASGGKPSEIDLGAFLAERNQGPEHEALRQLIGELIESNSIEAEYDDHD